MEKSVVTTVRENSVTKVAATEAGKERLRRERAVYKKLGGAAHIPELIKATEDSLTVSHVSGINAKQWLHFEEDWSAKPLSWNAARISLAHYVDAEMELVDNGVLYRDLNLEHLIFTKHKAMMIDLEEAVLADGQGRWHFNSQRGTWETMAPEEFAGHGELTTRTATYRVAVVAHLALTGRLPFPRTAHPIRSQVYKWRREHPAAVDTSLDKPVRRVFAAALSRQPERRHATPKAFIAKLESAYEQ